MNVKREIEAANRRVQAQIDASARAALERIGVDVDAMEREAVEKRAQEARAAFAAFGTQLAAGWEAVVSLTTALAAAVLDAFEEPKR